jgi:hypothetical protein
MSETMSYYEQLRQNNGEKAHEITEERFWEMLEVLPPAKWTRRADSESFMVIECQTANLYTWCARVGDKYYEMIAPNDCTHRDILNNVVMSLT